MEIKIINIDKKMKLFKSKYRNRIEDKIRFLETEHTLVIYEKQDTNQIRSTHDYCKLVIKEHDLNDKIELLKSLYKGA
jgi:hypothetical protein